jgi:starvation-inducible outer membrane lipoprotein
VELSKRPRGWWRDLLVIGAGGLFVFTCAPAAIFPPEVLEKVDRTVTFEQVVNHPDEYQGRVVELGGQILGSMVKGEEVQVLVRVLPIQTKPVYGPVDRDGERGMFIIRYTGKVGEQDLQRGNMVIVIGPVLGGVVTSLTGVPVSRPTVSAECFHIWRTQGEPIEDYPYPKNSSRFVPLVQQTYCINRTNTILTTT